MKKLRLGTRKSQLAMWQAQEAKAALVDAGYEVEIVKISSDGDLNLKQPIYELGITGVFTKSLDIALINNEVDVAVHSLKDVPTQMPIGLHLSAVLPRGNAKDILVYKSYEIYDLPKRTIATGSLRRRAFWLNKYPNDKMVDLRGNVQLRLKKLLENTWDGAIFAYAGLERCNILEQLEGMGLRYTSIDNMISAPSQGIVGLVCREDLNLSRVNDKKAMQCATIERDFLRTLEGGCTAPIGGLAKISRDKVIFKGAILSLNGKQSISINEEVDIHSSDNLGEYFANKCIEKGADKILNDIKKTLG